MLDDRHMWCSELETDLLYILKRLRVIDIEFTSMRTSVNYPWLVGDDGAGWSFEMEYLVSIPSEVPRE